MFGDVCNGILGDGLDVSAGLNFISSKLLFINVEVKSFGADLGLEVVTGIGLMDGSI